MARPSAWRVFVLVMICIPTVAGVWAAYNIGRDALGDMGGALVAFVAALMLGSIAWIAGVLLLGSAEPSPRSRAGSPSQSGRSGPREDQRTEREQLRQRMSGGG